MKNIVVLGSTGSIGTQTLSVAAAHPDEFAITALAVNTSAEKLAAQTARFHPDCAVIYDRTAYEKARMDWPFPQTKLLCGMEGLLEIVRLPQADIVLTAMVGMIGLRPTVEAILAKKTIALANKETLVCAGSLIMKLAQENGVSVLPVDSEHCAIFQSLMGVRSDQVEKIWLTASGGPFRGYSAEQLRTVTKAQALKHPSWNMGAKITIDSASMVNKALEMIEARWLFGVREDQIKVLIHPQSIVHSAVELVDGTVMAQLGVTDMRLPIQVALTYPQRSSRVVERLDLARLHTLTFEEPDEETFLPLKMARTVLRKGGLYPAALNIANEIAVRKFLQEEIPFTGIYAMLEETLEYMDQAQWDPDYTLEDIFVLENELRKRFDR